MDNSQASCLSRTITGSMRCMPVLAPLLYLFLLLLFPPHLNEDSLALAAALSWGEPSPHLIHIGYLLSYPMMVGRIIIPEIEWFTLSQIILNTISIGVFAYSVITPHRHESIGWREIMGLICIGCYIILSISHMYFPWTGCAGMVAGLLLMFKGVSQQLRIVCTLCGLLLVLLGGSMRYDSCPVLLPYVGMLFILFLIERQWKQLWVTVAAGVCIIGINTSQHLFANVSMWEPNAHHQSQNIITVNDARMRFCDYVDLHDEEKTQDYAALGLSQNDKELLSSFMYVIEQRSRPGWWEAIREVRDRHNSRIPHSFKDAWERISSPSIYRYLYLPQPRRYLAGKLLPLMLLLLLPLPRRWSDGRIWIFAATLAAIFAMMLIGRVNQQGTVSVYILAGGLLAGFIPRRKISSAWSKGIVLVLAATCCVSSAIKLHPLYSPLSPRFHDEEKTKLLTQEFSSHPEQIYIVLASAYSPYMWPTFTLKTSAFRVCPNAIPYGHWMYLMPSVQQHMNRAGIESDLTVLCHPEYRFVFGNENCMNLVLLYMEEHHGLHLRFVLEKRLGDDLGVYRIETVPDSDPSPQKLDNKPGEE